MLSSILFAYLHPIKAPGFRMVFSWGASFRIHRASFVSIRRTMMQTKKRYRPDMDGSFQQAYEKNRRIVLAQGEVCAICGLPVNKHLRFPDPMSPSVDHIIPVSKGGHPSDLSNLQLTHLICNQVKGSKLVIEDNKNLIKKTEMVSNRILPLSMDWTMYHPS